MSTISTESPITHDSPPFIEIEGVRIFGKPITLVTIDEIRNLRQSPETLLRVVRHLRSVSSDARKRLCALRTLHVGQIIKIDSDLIDAHLATKASKFSPCMNDPWKALAGIIEVIAHSLSQGKELYWQQHSRTKELIAVFHTNVPAICKKYFGIPTYEPLGMSAVIKITDEIRSRILSGVRGYAEAKDSAPVQVAQSVAPEPTDALTVFFKKKIGQIVPDLYTVYTGRMSPDLPRPYDQTVEEHQYNSDFWSKHAFIEM